MSAQIRFIGYIGDFNGNFSVENVSKHFGVSLQEGDMFFFDHDAYDEKTVLRTPNKNSGLQQFNCPFYTGDVLLVTEIIKYPYSVKYKKLSTSNDNAHLSFLGIIDNVDTLSSILKKNLLNYGDCFIVGVSKSADLASFASLLGLKKVEYLDMVTVGNAFYKNAYYTSSLGAYLKSTIESTVTNSKNVIHYKQLNMDSLTSTADLDMNTFYHITPNNERYVEFNGKFYVDLKIFVAANGLIDVLNKNTSYTKLTEGRFPKVGSGKYSDIPVDSNVYEEGGKLFVPEPIFQYDPNGTITDTLYGVLNLVEGTSAGDVERYETGVRFTMLDSMSSVRYSTYKLIAPDPEYSREFNGFKNGEIVLTLPSVTSTMIGRNSKRALTPTHFTKVSSTPDVVEDSLLREVDNVLEYIGQAFTLTELWLKGPAGQIAIIANDGDSHGRFTLPEKGGVLATNETITEITNEGDDFFLSMFKGTTSVGVKKLVNSPLMKTTVKEAGAKVAMTVAVDEEGNHSGGIGANFMRAKKLSITNNLSELDNDTVSVLPLRDDSYRSFDFNGNHIAHKQREITMPHWSGEILTSEGPVDGGIY